MASSKTPNLGLDIWQPDDYFKRVEVNNNFTKIDAKAKENSDKVEVLSGKFSNINTTFKKPILSVPEFNESLTQKLSEANGVSSMTSPRTINFLLNDKNTPNPLFSYFGNKPKAGVGNMSLRSEGTIKGESIGGLLIKFSLYGSKFELIEMGTNTLIRVMVNGKHVGKADTALTVSSGRTYFRTYDLGSTGYYDITIFLEKFSELYGLNIEQNATIIPYTEKKPFVMFFGDSITESNSGNGQRTAFGYPAIVSQKLNFDGWISGLGGTGYINPSNSPKVKFVDRLQTDVVSYNPDILVVCGGLNDESYSISSVTNEIKNFYTQAKSLLPNAKIIVTSPFSPSGTIPAIRQQITDVLKATALEFKLPFIDMLTGSTYDKDGNVLILNSGGFITGIGNEGNPQATGNASLFISSDGTHPNRLGYRYLGERMSQEIYRILYN